MDLRSIRHIPQLPGISGQTEPPWAFKRLRLMPAVAFTTSQSQRITLTHASAATSTTMDFSSILSRLSSILACCPSSHSVSSQTTLPIYSTMTSCMSSARCTPWTPCSSRIRNLAPSIVGHTRPYDLNLSQRRSLTSKSSVDADIREQTHAEYNKYKTAFSRMTGLRMAKLVATAGFGSPFDPTPHHFKSALPRQVVSQAK